MTQAAYDAFGWLSNSFYVIIALAVVYLYFFRIVPLVAGKIDWTVLSIVRLTAVLILVAALLGVVAVNTADWIFTNVLDTLPSTRMAYEIDKVTGPVVHLTTQESNGLRVRAPWAKDYPMPYDNGDGYDGEGSESQNDSAAENPVPVVPQIVLKPNAMSIWAGKIQKQFNTTGTLSDNDNVLTRRDLPNGVACDVYAVADGWQTKRYEDWLLRCSNDGFATFTDIQVNGIAARGLTAGDYYSAENRVQVFGEGQWPPEAIDRVVVPEVSGGNLLERGGVSVGEAATGGPNLSSAAAVSAAPTNSLTYENGERLHTVQNGENLATIAETYGLKVYQIVNANAVRYPQLATDPNVIRTGWRLAIPQ